MVTERELYAQVPNLPFTALLHLGSLCVFLLTDFPDGGERNQAFPQILICNPNHLLSVLLAVPALCYHLSQKHCLDKDKLEQLLALKQNRELFLFSPRAVYWSTIFEGVPYL